MEAAEGRGGAMKRVTKCTAWRSNKAFSHFRF
jgi:hypothetical protein